VLEWVDYKGYRILVLHADHLADDKVLEAIGEFEQAILRTPSGVRVRSVASTIGVRVSGAMRDRWNQFVECTQHVDHIRANVGAVGFSRVVASLLAPDIYFATSMEDALEHLVSKGG
jgi:hypothetical protein